MRTEESITHFAWFLVVIFDELHTVITAGHAVALTTQTISFRSLLFSQTLCVCLCVRKSYSILSLLWLGTVKTLSSSAMPPPMYSFAMFFLLSQGQQFLGLNFIFCSHDF